LEETAAGAPQNALAKVDKVKFVGTYKEDPFIFLTKDNPVTKEFL
jgi:hypothetical protein